MATTFAGNAVEQMGLNLLQDVLLYGADAAIVWKQLDRFMVVLGINDAYARLEADEDD